jgi:hypothetical protein
MIENLFDSGTFSTSKEKSLVYNIVIDVFLENSNNIENEIVI